MKKRLLIGSIVLSLALPAAALAQTVAPATSPAPPPDLASAPYDSDLQRLAEILGSLQ